MNNPIIERIIWLVEFHSAISEKELELQLLGEFDFYPIDKIKEAISSASQGGLVKRVEFTLPDNQYRHVYLPATARIV